MHIYVSFIARLPFQASSNPLWDKVYNPFNMWWMRSLQIN